MGFGLTRTIRIFPLTKQNGFFLKSYIMQQKQKILRINSYQPYIFYLKRRKVENAVYTQRVVGCQQPYLPFSAGHEIYLTRLTKAIRFFRFGLGSEIL